MATTGEVIPSITLSATGQPEAVVVAEEATKAAEVEDVPQTSLFVAEVASLINHEDIQAILATQADMYVQSNIPFTISTHNSSTSQNKTHHHSFHHHVCKFSFHL